MAQTPDIGSEMPKAYEPGKVEQKWYKYWLEKGYFTPKIGPQKNPFVIIMPPPNVTGELHLGHALTATLEDIMTRWHRMKGDPTLWLPSFDHAGIATQVVVERQLAKEGLTRQQLGREKFIARTWQWARQCHEAIIAQHQRLGISCDWTRECFTLDEGPSRAVRTAFVRLYKKGLIYRGERLINWCPRCATALSDLEVEHKDINGHLYYVRYQLAENKNEFITVATTRPETILGDTAVAVSPCDERFKDLIGKKVILPVINRQIPIIADEAVDLEFGTGAVKITPAHDPVDFEVAQRHGLPMINILNTDVTMNENAGACKGLDRFDCRKQILVDLEKDGLLFRVEPYVHSVGHCHRCGTIVEPLVSKQWFVKMPPLAEPAIKAVQEERITILPGRFTKVYLNWMENIRDWCISRQLWWGHRIPVWYCRRCEGLTVAVEPPQSCQGCGSIEIEQDTDVLDTWFSSALWPHSTLGWPDDTEDLRYFYPTSVMETAYDILFFWVARMIMMGLEDTGDIPFRTVYLHGLVRDEKGEKMSKTRGNVVDPIDILEKHGTDALRFALSTGTSPGNDIKLTLSKLEASRNFANKLWNAARFVIRSLEPGTMIEREINSEGLLAEDRWILSRLSRTVSGVTSLMEDFQFGEAQRQVHDFLWGEYCDWYIEFAKIRLSSGQSHSPQPVLVHVLEVSLRLLHPYMPFITEELWQNLKKYISQVDTDSIMVTAYPEPVKGAIDLDAESEMESITEIIRSIRNVRAEYKVESNRWIEARIHAEPAIGHSIECHVEAIRSLARANPITFTEAGPEDSTKDNAVVLPLAKATVVIPMASMVDLEAEKKRTLKEIEQSQAEVDRLEARLRDQVFLTRAPVAVIEKERQKLYTLTDKLKKLKQQSSRF